MTIHHVLFYEYVEDILDKGTTQALPDLPPPAQRDTPQVCFELVRALHSKGAARFYCLVRFAGRPGNQEIVAGRDDALGNRGYLRRRLTGSEDHFGKTLADASLMVDACEPQILEGGLA